MQLFFKRGRQTSDEPSDTEVERDVKALLEGRKDGKIVIENETPRAKGGKHLVFDDTHKDRIISRESESGEAND